MADIDEGELRKEVDEVLHGTKRNQGPRSSSRTAALTSST